MNEYSAINLPPSIKEYEDDPYAISFYNNRRRKHHLMDDRANSYLPYSHHDRDPYEKTTPIYIEECIVPPSNLLGVGSLLQDNRNNSVNLSLTEHTPIHNNHSHNHSNSNSSHRYNDKMVDMLPEISKRKKQRECCGMNYRLLVLILIIFIAIIVTIWYFVWPRIPTLILDDVDNIGKIIVSTNTTEKSMATDWFVNMTTTNGKNWVPTRIKSIDLVFIDNNTNQRFGHGTLESIVLPANTPSIVTFLVKIKYQTDNFDDKTFQDLYNACGIQVASPVPFENQQDVLNVIIHVTYRISGIAWSSHQTIPAPNLVCPTS